MEYRRNMHGESLTNYHSLFNIEIEKIWKSKTLQNENNN
jgi:hypothetical protein